MKFLISSLLLIVFLTGYAQPKIRRFPNSINNPSINVYSPFISLDGSVILFMSDYAALDPLIYYSLREPGDWKEPVELPKHLNTKLHYIKGYTLSPDGKTIYVSSIKSGGVGGYDIWASEFKNGVWGEIKNLFSPINSKGNEASPTFTPDGSTVYFMRCDKIDYQKAGGCKIYFSKKKPNGTWDEPAELPAHINTGNSQTPRIMADGETLIFSSDKILPSTGGMDLYSTKLNNGEWGNPVPLSFINTEKDDQYVSAQANGRYLLKEGKGKLKLEILEYLIPDEIRPRGVMKVEGFVSTNGAAVPAYVSAIDLKTQERVFSGRPSPDGSFFLFIKEGGVYEIAVDPEDGTMTYYTKQYDLTKNEPLKNDKLTIALKKISVGDEFPIDAVKFKPYTSELDMSSSELNRIARLLKSNPNFNFEIQVTLNGYLEDTVKTNPDLTEEVNTSITKTFSFSDSLGNITTRDSVIVRTLFHNNRSEKQGAAFIDKLISLGVNRNNLNVTATKQAAPDQAAKNVAFKIIARTKE